MKPANSTRLPAWLVSAALLVVGFQSLVAAGADFAEVPLATGKLFIPTNWPPRDGRADLLVFFHGHPPLVCSDLARSGKSAALVVVNFNGLSAAYATPFKDTNLFGKILAEARAKLAERAGRELAPGRLGVASFSAGYGAVREILKQPRYFDSITDLVLLDSLYAGYAERDGLKVVEPEHVQDFIRFARCAADGQARMVLTHSAQVPGGYASTTETADAILAALGLARKPADGVDASGMGRDSTADAGGFHLRAFKGTGAQDHMNHLRHADAALALTSLPARE
ncbi:MAG: hypothetical protein HY301_13815 [Verrucomicrobia bacterium]|nr:hypothetical protein [Verrucomicrobiota bacterium]